MSARLRVDWTRCDGHGLCAELLRESIALDEWGFPVLGEAGAVPDHVQAEVRRAVHACPTLALILSR